MSIVEVACILQKYTKQIFVKQKTKKKELLLNNFFFGMIVFKWKCKLMMMLRMRIRKAQVAAWNAQISFHIDIDEGTHKKRVSLKC